MSQELPKGHTNCSWNWNHVTLTICDMFLQNIFNFASLCFLKSHSFPFKWNLSWSVPFRTFCDDEIPYIKWNIFLNYSYNLIDLFSMKQTFCKTNILCFDNNWYYLRAVSFKVIWYWKFAIQVPILLGYRDISLRLWLGMELMTSAQPLVETDCPGYWRKTQLCQKSDVRFNFSQ